MLLKVKDTHFCSCFSRRSSVHLYSIKLKVILRLYFGYKFLWTNICAQGVYHGVVIRFLFWNSFHFFLKAYCKITLSFLISSWVNALIKITTKKHLVLLYKIIHIYVWHSRWVGVCVCVYTYIIKLREQMILQCTRA